MMNTDLIDRLNESLSGKSPEEVLEEVIREFGDAIAFSSSLGAEDQVITAMLAKISPNTGIFTLDTGRMFPETYQLLDRTRNRYGMNIRVYFPDAAQVEEMVNTRGIDLFYESVENRKLCCHIRKLEPLSRALKGLDAWITGLRRQQSVTRSDMRLVEWDEANHLIKVNPLIEWTDKQVWDYIHAHNVPYNLLHDAGFPSIGCQPCTRAVAEGEDIRAGRWWWELPGNRECGLHARKS